MPSAHQSPSIEASIDCLSLDLGRVAIPAEACLFSLLSECFSKIRAIFNLYDPDGILAQSSALERILSAIFDTTSLAFVTERTVRILAGLDDHDKSCLFVQAVAGMTLLFRRLSSVGSVLSDAIISRELQRFAESEHRRLMLEKIGGSSLFSSCYTKSSIVDFVMAAIEEQEVVRRDRLPLSNAGEDLLSDAVAWVSDRPCKNMGLPWGFTIMTLN
ncbi:b51d84b4-da12-4096-a68e-129db14958f7 [Thermothielavioides terrestris]|uniref:B51d84b4-da12-4096-a68e-129db14958f7 n=1 Tax=Thermothielavioides terrestris TaxID=2587410 RepID=A0A446BPU5_9PEZI|nr:b51d84b4-da12-4096-a68e-129db14958f7 [Thermothielavioides terrestris]